MVDSAHRRRTRRRARRDWLARGALAALTVVSGGISVAYSMAQTVAETDTTLAHRLAPYDGRITAMKAAALSGPDAGIDERARADRLARRALRQDATAVVAVTTLGLNAQVRGDVATARRLFAFSEKLSRRNLLTQLWAIEDAVGRGDITGALRHYDIALRTSSRAPEVLYPILAAATANPQIRDALIRTLAARPLWTNGFLVHLAAEARDPRSAVALFSGLRRVGVEVPEGARVDVINTLLNGGFLDEAWTYYASIRPGAVRYRSRDPRFGATYAASLFDWEPVNDAGVSSSIQRGEQGGLVDFSVSPGAGGPVLQQIQMLPPGTYWLSGRSRGVEQETAAQPYWVLTCRTNGSELGRMPLPNSGEANGAFNGRFVVPANCHTQTLALIARPSDALGGVTGQITRAELVPAR